MVAMALRLQIKIDVSNFAMEDDVRDISVLIITIKGQLNRWLGVRKDHYMILLHMAALCYPLSMVHAVLWTIKQANRVEIRSLCSIHTLQYLAYLSA